MSDKLYDLIRDLHNSADNAGCSDDLTVVSQEGLLAVYREMLAVKGDLNQITIDLNVIDNAGVVVDATTADLTRAQISDIIDHAAQLVLMSRSGQKEQIDLVHADLEEALIVANVLEFDPPLPTGEELSDQYGTWGEISHFSRGDWRCEVGNNDTSLGYWDWVAGQLESMIDDLSGEGYRIISTAVGFRFVKPTGEESAATYFTVTEAWLAVPK